MKFSYNVSIDIFGVQMVTPESKPAVPLDWCLMNRENNLELFMNFNLPSESWFSPQYGRETKRYRDKGTPSKKSSFCKYWGTDYVQQKDNLTKQWSSQTNSIVCFLCFFCDEGEKDEKDP